MKPRNEDATCKYCGLRITRGGPYKHRWAHRDDDDITFGFLPFERLICPAPSAPARKWHEPREER